MKKKASLWISGITTVAMLAVAVGSFAAWDTLKDKTDGFTVSTSTPIELAISNDVPNSSALKLVPENAIIDNKTEASEVKVGAFTAKISGTTADKVANTTIKGGVYNDTNEGTAVNTAYKVYLYKASDYGDGSSPSNGVELSQTAASLTTADLATEAGQDYVVTVKFANNNTSFSTDAEKSSKDNQITRNVKVELEAAQ